MKTQAAILYKINSPLAVEEIEIPDLCEGQVLVKILCSGVCRSQLNEIQGLKGPDPHLPHLLGHEGSGVVEDVGRGVKKVKREDAVILSWIKSAGMDVPRSQYRQGRKIIKSGAIATFTEYAVISENRLTPLPNDIPADHAALLGCAVPTGAGVVLNTLAVKPGSSIAIFGIGGIGASAVLAARMSGCAQIIAVDISKRKLDFAKTLGATQCFDARRKNILSLLQKFPGGIDYGVECSGAKSAMELAFQVVKDCGSVVIAGNLKKGEKISIDPFDLIKGKKIVGTWGGETSPERDFEKYLQAYRAGHLPLDALITHRFRLEQINQALEVLKAGQAGRIVIDFE